MRTIAAIVTLLGFLLVASGFAKPPVVKFPIEFQITAPNPLTSVHEKVIIQSDGKATLETLSLFNEPTGENRIGHFTATLSSEVLEIVKALVIATQATIHNEKSFPGEATIFFLKTDDTFALQWLASEDPISKQWEQTYQEIRKLGLKNPEAALQLRCESDVGGFLCFYRNIGTANVVTIDPLSVPRSLTCIRENNVPRFLSGQKETAPKADFKRIEIAPKSSYSFKIVTKDQCTTRLRVDTSEARFYPSFRGVLAGELLSNELR